MAGNGDGDNPETRKGHGEDEGVEPIVLLNTVGKLADKVLAEKMAGFRELWHERAFAGRKGRRAIDSVMLMDELRRKTGGLYTGGTSSRRSTAWTAISCIASCRGTRK